MALLTVEDLSVTIATPRGPARVLRDVCLDLAPGQRLGLVGESGCGKSMTALAIMGLLPEAATATGRIALAGDDILGADEDALCRIRGRRVSMVFQEPMTALNPVIPIGQQVAEGIRLHFAVGRGEAETRARRVLDRVGLAPRRFPPDLYPHQLSGGQRQRVVVAIALAGEPDLLIADEPTTALDVTIQAQILDLIGDVVGERQRALIMISHDLGIVAETTEQVAVMYAGAVVESGPTAAVFRHMAHPYTRGLFAAIPHGQPAPSTGGRRPRLATIPGQVPDPRRLPPGCAFADRCGRVADICRRGPPAAAPVADGHAVACHFPHDADGRDG
jgi:peptide/nickel transport system ATP-binding protein